MAAIEKKGCVFQKHIATRPERVLLIGYFDPRGISTVPEILGAIQQLSSLAVVCLNLFDHPHDNGYLTLNPEIDLDAFEVLIVHNTVAYNPANVVSLDRLLGRKFADFGGVKVLFKQDENFHFQETALAIRQMRFDLVLTCLPQSEWRKIYPKEVVGSDIHFSQMLTGYVTPALRARFSLESVLSDRPIDIGYRGSIQPIDFGRLCYEKRQIGDEVKLRLATRNLKLDISSRWEDRFGGEAWFEFLLRSKCILGVESGASIFDLNGDLKDRVEAFIQAHGPLSEDAKYSERFLESIADLEGNVAYNQISPRHFEAAACGAVQIMYPGEYSKIFFPERHYLVLERDFSNLPTVIERAMDPAVRREIALRAFDEIIQNRDYWIETFVERLDELILARLESKGRARKSRVTSKKRAHHGLLIAPHRARLDPRLRWFAEGAPNDLCIGLMGLQLGGTESSTSSFSIPNFVGDQPVLEADDHWLNLMCSMVGTDPAGNAALRELLELDRAEAMSDLALCERFGAPTSSKRLESFRWYLRYLLNVTRSLIMPALSMRGLCFVVAADLPTLPAALILKAVLGVKVIYDAHEYWAENDACSAPFEIAFWQAIERRLVVHADKCQVVSPGLASLLSQETGCHFESIPNCNPSNPLAPNQKPQQADTGPVVTQSVTKVRFLFQGLVSPGRGLEILLEAWRNVPENAQLVIRGPDGEFKEVLRKLVVEYGLTSDAVQFAPAIDEDSLVTGAAEFDVGIVPYPASNTNNANCCPNKLSQYMAAGLAILANDTNFVREVVSTANCGVVVDFGRADQLIAAIQRLASCDNDRILMANNARSYFTHEFNWEAVSRSMYRSILDMVSSRDKTILVSWPIESYSVYKISTTDAIGSMKPQDSSLEMSKELLLAQKLIKETRGQKFIYVIAYFVWSVIPVRIKMKLQPLKQWILRTGVI